jgi:hypothetical protein
LVVLAKMRLRQDNTHVETTRRCNISWTRVCTADSRYYFLVLCCAFRFIHDDDTGIRRWECASTQSDILCVCRSRSSSSYRETRYTSFNVLDVHAVVCVYVCVDTRFSSRLP